MTKKVKIVQAWKKKIKLMKISKKIMKLKMRMVHPPHVKIFGLIGMIVMSMKLQYMMKMLIRIGKTMMININNYYFILFHVGVFYVIIEFLEFVLYHSLNLINNIYYITTKLSLNRTCCLVKFD